ncbi:MAG: hypothetical protein L3J25_11650 [Flavobacteriaceae bacterium]|nr:hypothetical protein [Flavobacteriaceae bacterium]
MKTKLLLAIFFLFSIVFYSQSSLIAYYPFNGNANDESGNANNGTVNGATLTTDRFGNPDRAYSFNGIDNFILCNTQVGPFGSDSRTVSFWAKTDVAPISTLQQNAVLSYGGNINDGGSRFEILLNPKCRGLGVDVSSNYTTKSFDNSDNNWHFYTIVFDNSISNALSDLKFYGDGVLLTSVCNSNGNININTLDEQVLNIGRLFYSGQPRYFKGAIDDIKIYNKALTDEEIKNSYNNLIVYYPFNGNANDESGNNLNGTVSGATLIDDRFGNPSSAYSFDGNDIITIAHNDILNCSNELSISVWVKPNSLQDAMILGKSNYTSNTNYLLRTKSTGYIAFEYKDFTNSNSLPLTAGVWNHIAVISKSDNSKLVYINGILATHTSATSPYGLVTNVLTIGARPGAEFFNGSIDDLRMYKSALTESDVLNLYNNNSLDISDNQLEQANTFYVYSNRLYFDGTQNLSEIKNISIFNLLAQKVFESNAIQKETSLSFLQQGLFILKVEFKNGRIGTKKILIL